MNFKNKGYDETNESLSFLIKRSCQFRWVKIQVSKQGIQSPAISTHGVALLQCGHMLTGLCLGFLMPSFLLPWLGKSFASKPSHMQNFLSTVFLQRSHSIYHPWFILSLLAMTCRYHVPTMQADYSLRLGNTGLFFRTTKLFSLYFSKLISS